MLEEIKEFILVWNKYFNALPINEHEFDKYVKIIHKLRKETELNFAETHVLLELCELMAESIFIVEQCADKYEMDYYQQTRVYDESELNSCSCVITFLKDYISWEQLNACNNMART